MNKYYIYHPRNFANEYTAIVVSNKDEEKELLEWWKNCTNTNGRFYRITVKDLRKYCSDEAYAKKTDKAFSGYCNPDDPISVYDFLHWSD